MPGEIYILGWGFPWWGKGFDSWLASFNDQETSGGWGSLGALQASPHLPVPVFPGLACGSGPGKLSRASLGRTAR